MELSRSELYLLDCSLEALIEHHKCEIEEIKELDEEHYQFKMILNIFRKTPLTADDWRQKDIEKEKNSIKELKSLKSKLFLSNNRLLVVSDRIQLCLSSK